MTRLSNEGWLIKAITITSIFSIFLSAVLFYISNSLNDRSIEYIRGGMEAIKLESLHRDLAIADELKAKVTDDPTLENMIAGISWRQFLKVRGTPVDIEELSRVQNVSDWKVNFSTSSIEFINDYYRSILINVHRLTDWQNRVFFLLIATQTVNAFFVAKLAFLRKATKESNFDNAVKKTLSENN